jgi:hypothetical protein
MLGLSQYYHCSKDNDNQLVVNIEFISHSPSFSGATYITFNVKHQGLLFHFLLPLVTYSCFYFIVNSCYTLLPWLRYPPYFTC